VRELGCLAESINVSLAQFAIAWLLRLPEITSVIIGASKSSQLKENLGALDVLPKLDEGILDRVESILCNKPEFPD
jgi:aryl-alcohol dehydrogenase-like predicted oxidoreductase